MQKSEMEMKMKMKKCVKLRKSFCFFHYFLALFLYSTAFPEFSNTVFAKYSFFGKYFKNKATEYFLKFLFLFESTVLPVNNEK